MNAGEKTALKSNKLSPLESARWWLQRGFHPIPVPDRGKAPKNSGWPSMRLSESDLAQHFNGRAMNIGIILGVDGAADVNCDCPEAIAAAPFLLPETHLIFGRASTPAAHYLYRCDPPVASEKHTDKLLSGKAATIVELRCLKKDGSIGYQTVVPGSTHETGEAIRFEPGCDQQAATVQAACLKTVVARVAAAVLLARHFPKPKGGRNDAFLALAGILARAGWKSEDAGPFNFALYRILFGPEADRAACSQEVKATFMKHDAGEEVTGIPRLRTLIPEQVITTALKYLGIKLRAEGTTTPADAASATDRQPSPKPLGVAADQTVKYRDTDLGNARRFVDQHCANVRYCPQMGKWFTWDGNRWSLDDTDEILLLARKTIESIWREADAAAAPSERDFLKKWGKRSESEGKIRAMVSLAASEPEVRVNPGALDTDPMLLNCTNGTVDLRTGELRAHSRNDLCTKLAPVPYDPDAKCPLWRKFLNTVTDGDEQIQAFLQAIVGYALTGNTTEQAIFMLYGTGANGKSTFIERIRAMFGDYARNANFSTFLAMEESSARNDLARLVGARLVTAVEVERGRRFSEVVIKQITGGDPITARYLFHEYFEYSPQFKVFLAVNHKPRIRGGEHAIWRRIKPVPFTVTIPPEEQDRDLVAKLRGELPGILRWAVKGCLAWQGPGLSLPQAVMDAVREYRGEMDLLGGFLEARCVLSAEAITTSATLYEAYGEYCQENCEPPLNKKQFGVCLEERGLRPDRMKKQGHRAWKGIALRAKETG
jgi:putative DNA primase/helicase